MKAAMSNNSSSAKWIVACVAILFSIQAMPFLTACSDFEAAPDATAGTDTAKNDDQDDGPGNHGDRDTATADTGSEGDEDTAQAGVDTWQDPGRDRDVIAAEDTAATGTDGGGQPGEDAATPDIDEVDPIENTGCPGYVGCACEDTGDCLSGLCAPTPDGHKCTRMCTTGDECGKDEVCRLFENGSGSDTLYACLSKWPTACRPCLTDSDCAVSWLDQDMQPVCFGPIVGPTYCAPIADPNPNPEYALLLCPDGYSERRVELDQGVADICTIDADTCPCREEWQHPGYETTCANYNMYGTCTAARLCNQECPAAEPQAETCDSQDNDCNGLVDDGIDGGTCNIANEIGTCIGQSKCANGVEICLGDEASVERCDGIDNDCDGLVDEDLGQTSCGINACHHTISNCLAGMPQVCNPLQGMGIERCNKIDDDCDGRTDEELGTVSCGVGSCRTTVIACENGAPNACEPLPAGSEVCNGKDDDCDGKTDEGFGDVTCGVAACQHTIQECVGGRKVTCDPYEGSVDEICNGLDDNCDGFADNGISAAAIQHESNGTIGDPWDLGDLLEGDPTMVVESMIYPAGDVDWFKVHAVEGDHSCVWHTDQDYKITVTLFNPVGPLPCTPVTVSLYNASEVALVTDLDSACTSHGVEYKWDGSCGPDDSRSFYIKIQGYNSRTTSCMPYKVYITMTKI